MSRTISFHFGEIEAERLVPMDAYDDEGNVIGDNPDYDKHCTEVREMTVFRATMIHDGDQLTIQSRHCLKEEREHAMIEMMGAAGKVAYERLFNDPR